MADPELRRRSQSRATRRTAPVPQLPFAPVHYRLPPLEPLSADQVEAIHTQALMVLAVIGMRVLEPAARAHYARAGAEIDAADLRVRFPPGMIEPLIALAPATFMLAARDPAHNLIVGGDSAIFASVGGPAFVMDLDRGRRSGCMAEVEDYLRLIQSLNVLHQEGGGPFEAMDLPAPTRHLDLHLAQIRLLSKNWQPVGLGAERALDGLEMAAIMLGRPRERLHETCLFTCVINTNSPLQLDIPMAEGLMLMAEHGQCVVVTPFTLAGAMAPVTLAGALTQQHAEAMAGIALCQIVRPGAPVMYGGFTSNVDMKSGAPAFGTPEYVRAAQGSGQLARRLGVPFRSSNVTSANDVDAQAAYESQMALWGAMTGHANMILHAAGWLGGGLTASFEKLILDAEMLQMLVASMQPIDTSPAALAFDAMQEVGPAGHFFGTQHTLQRYATAFHAPMLSNWDNHDSWRQRGSPTAPQRANVVWKQLLREYQQPPLDAGLDEALAAYVARRKSEGGARG